MGYRLGVCSRTEGIVSMSFTPSWRFFSQFDESAMVKGLTTQTGFWFSATAGTPNMVNDGPFSSWPNEY